MMNKSRVFIILLIVSVVLVLFKNNIEMVYNKELITKDSCFINNSKINCSCIYDIIRDQKNHWSFSMASYVTENYVIRSKKTYVYFTLKKGFIILNYKHKYFGWVQVISEKEYLECKKNITQFEDEAEVAPFIFEYGDYKQ